MSFAPVMKTLQGFVLSFFFLSLAHAQPFVFQESGIDCDDCDCIKRILVDADYLYWKIKDSPKVIPLVATAPVIHNGDPVLGEPGAKVVLGGKDVRNNWRSGGRFNFGYAFDAPFCFSAEAAYFFLVKDSKGHKVSSSGLPGSRYLTVPYFNTLTKTESSSPVAEPGTFRGLAKLNLSNWMQGAELNGWINLYSNCSYCLSGMIGFRYWNFNEHLKFSVDSPEVDVPANIYLVKDRFNVQNNFYAGQIGFKVDGGCQRIFYNASGKIALGAMREELSIRGKFITNSFDGFGAPEVFKGGYFALPSNIGHHKRTQFAVIPEFAFNIGYSLSNCFSLRLGYTFLYVNKMLWAGKQMKRHINPSQSPLYEFTSTPTSVGKPNPKASLKAESLWVQGINVGIEYRF